jgi:adenine-specific DNA-methyltransferase
VPKQENILNTKSKRMLQIPTFDKPATILEGSAETLFGFMKSHGHRADLIFTSPPYNLGKEYEPLLSIKEYVSWQRAIITLASKCLSNHGNICWQVGNYVANGQIIPLDVLLHPIFTSLGFKLRNRIVWHFGHGLHAKRRFSGRYETILWYSKQDDYFFDLDSVRIPSKYPGKRHYKGPNKGHLSSDPRGKNPEDYWEFEEDVWDIPNVKGNHVEKTTHPCQFPVGLAERIILSLCPAGGLVVDPFSGVATSGVAALIHGRRFIGSETSKKYVQVGIKRLKDAIAGRIRYRPHDRPIYDHTLSPLAHRPKR